MVVVIVMIIIRMMHTQYILWQRCKNFRSTLGGNELVMTMCLIQGFLYGSFLYESFPFLVNGGGDGQPFASGSGGI